MSAANASTGGCRVWRQPRNVLLLSSDTAATHHAKAIAHLQSSSAEYMHGPSEYMFVTVGALMNNSH